jgi:sigma-B regulation protein RsbU (phosphoserine phosphatase)
MLHDLRDRLRLRTAMAVAVEVQQQLLPRAAPRIERLDIWGFSAYCDETGGDYFDYILLDRADGETSVAGTVPARTNDARGGSGLLVAIGDVAGHGIGPAIVMAGTRGILHSRAASCGHLGQLMTHLNDQLARDILPDRFVTMLLWYIDPRRGAACWANAGHDPAIIYDPGDDHFAESGRGNIPLGIEPGIAYEEYAYGPLRAGQVIVLGTDGIWEARGASGESYGKRRLMDVVRARAASTAEQIAHAVRLDLEAFRGAEHQRDDVTLVVIKVLPVDPSD